MWRKVYSPKVWQVVSWCCAACVFGVCLEASAGQPPLVAPNCGPNSPCIPNRTSFGYWPTRWHRWPGAEHPSAPAKPEEVPTPAPTPEKAPEKQPEKPTGPTTEPFEEEEFAPPPPQNLTPTGPQAPSKPETKLLPDNEPATLPSPPGKQKPKTSPSITDPFQDDTTQPEPEEKSESPPAMDETGEAEALTPETPDKEPPSDEEKSGQAKPMRWRSNLRTNSSRPAVSAAKKTSNQPRRLTGEPNKTARRATQVAELEDSSNPLRPAMQRERRVLTTAAWSPPPVEQPVTTMALRPNPLRPQ